MTQKDALGLLMMGKNVYLTGPAGSGKTYVLNVYIDYLKKHNVPVAVTATTGIAATHLNGGTIHSWSGIGIKNHLKPRDVSRIITNSSRQAKLQAAKVLIIDEISMFHSYRLDIVNHICKIARKDPRPFGGLQVILCGDFFQLPPINEKDFEDSSFAYKSQAWKELNLTVCYLEEQHRQQDDSFLQLLNEIRSQDVSDYTFEKLSGRLNKTLSKHLTPTKLYTHNIDVDGINNFELEKIKKPVHQYFMTTRGKKEFVDVMKKGCLAPEELLLKEDALVMFIKNNPAKGYINGTLGKVYGFDGNGYPLVQTYNGKKIIASPVSWQFEEEGTILAEINQIPLRLAWAITVNKSQGMSLDAAEIDLSKSFAYGMGYVALSRVKSLDGIRLLGISPTAFKVDPEIAKFDDVLKKLSNEAICHLEQLGETAMRKMQEEFLINVMPKDEQPESFESRIKALHIFFLVFILIVFFLVTICFILANDGMNIVSNYVATKNVKANSVDIHDPRDRSVIHSIQKPMHWPLHGTVVLEFGVINLPYYPLPTGIDIANAKDMLVTSFMDGTVVYAGEIFWGYGKHIIINHGNNITSLYGHLDKIYVYPGEKVTMDQVIGAEGETGWATGPHVHFETRAYGIPVNPRTFLAGNP